MLLNLKFNNSSTHFSARCFFFSASISLNYGYYGDRQMVLGPSSSRLFEASSLFVKQVQVSDDERKGVFLQGFVEKPSLSYENNWTVSDNLIVGSYRRKGFYLWLNKGSSIRMKWEAHTSSLGKLRVSLVKGELTYDTLLPHSTGSAGAIALTELTNGRVIEEDDRYYVGIINLNSKSVIMTLSIDVSSKMYDTTNAKSLCSTISGSCRLNLRFPCTEFVLVTTPNNGDLGGWNVELSFVARVVTYIAILGFVVVVIFVVLKYLGASDNGTNREEEPPLRERNETFPLVPEKTFRLPYGTDGGDEESGSSSPSEDLYDGKICVICYEMPRNCFYVPCGHCATCNNYAQRIMDDDNKVCPMCQRFIHRVRKLMIA